MMGSQRNTRVSHLQNHVHPFQLFLKGAFRFSNMTGIPLDRHYVRGAGEVGGMGAGGAVGAGEAGRVSYRSESFRTLLEGAV